MSKSSKETTAIRTDFGVEIFHTCAILALSVVCLFWKRARKTHQKNKDFISGKPPKNPWKRREKRRRKPGNPRKEQKKQGTQEKTRKEEGQGKSLRTDGDPNRCEPQCGSCCPSNRVAPWTSCNAWFSKQALIFFSLPFWKTARKTTKKARISSACRTPKILGKEGKTLKIARNSCICVKWGRFGILGGFPNTSKN